MLTFLNDPLLFKSFVSTHGDARFSSRSILHALLHCPCFLWERQVGVSAGILGASPTACLSLLPTWVQGPRYPIGVAGMNYCSSSLGGHLNLQPMFSCKGLCVGLRLQG